MRPVYRLALLPVAKAVTGENRAGQVRHVDGYLRSPEMKHIRSLQRMVGYDHIGFEQLCKAVNEVLEYPGRRPAGD